jgi:hypothetical protein
MRIEITKRDHVLVFEVAEESGIATFDKIRKVFNIITMNGESVPSGIDFFRERLEEKDRDVKQPHEVGLNSRRCTRCGAFTTYKRVESHGMCMKCEHELTLPSSPRTTGMYILHPRFTRTPHSH